MSAYENQLLAAFVYMLGYTSGRRGEACMAVNLFQQTPLDQRFGDLVVGSSSCVAFEFKRNAHSVGTEAGKWTRAGLELFLGTTELVEQGSRCHVLVFGTEDETEPSLRAGSYVEALEARGVPPHIDITPLLERITTAAEFGLPGKEVQGYLEAVALLKKWPPDDPGGGGSGRQPPPSNDSSWLAVLCDRTGDLRIRAAGSLEELLDARVPVGSAIEEEDESGNTFTA